MPWCLVFGAWGEASPDVECLLSALATAGSERHHRQMGTASATEARGGLAWLIRRRWAMTAVRENARLLLARLEHVGRGAAAAANRRQATGDGLAAQSSPGELPASSWPLEARVGGLLPEGSAHAEVCC